MKRFLSLLLALTLVIAIMPTSALAATTKTVYVSRNGGKIYLHTGPGYDYPTGSTVKHNAKVTIKDTDDEWTKVKVNSTGKTGWIRTMYVDGTTKALGNGYKAIKAKTKIYSKWNVNSSTKGTLVKGDTVRVNETSHDFARVVVTGSGVTGWIPIRCIGKTVDMKPDAPAKDAKVVYSTTASVLNMRKGPGTKYAIIAQLPHGTSVTILKSSGNWRRVQTLKGKIGWVHKSYLVKQGKNRVRTNGSNLNVRKGPGTDSAVLGSLRNGTRVTVKYTKGNWAYITGGGLTGYVSLNWLDI